MHHNREVKPRDGLRKQVQRRVSGLEEQMKRLRPVFVVVTCGDPHHAGVGLHGKRRVAQVVVPGNDFVQHGLPLLVLRVEPVHRRANGEVFVDIHDVWRQHVWRFVVVRDVHLYDVVVAQRRRAAVRRVDVNKIHQRAGFVVQDRVNVGFKVQGAGFQSELRQHQASDGDG